MPATAGSRNSPAPSPAGRPAATFRPRRGGHSGSSGGICKSRGRFSDTESLTRLTPQGVVQRSPGLSDDGRSTLGQLQNNRNPARVVESSSVRAACSAEPLQGSGLKITSTQGSPTEARLPWAALHNAFSVGSTLVVWNAAADRGYIVSGKSCFLHAPRRVVWCGHETADADTLISRSEITTLCEGSDDILTRIRNK